jgi:SNF2 family DNA or RNA helicase
MNELKRTAKPWVPHEYQQKALKFVLENTQSGLFLDPGLGKTSISLAMLKVLFKKRAAKRALVIAPKNVIYDVWPAEISEWKDFNDMGVAILHGSNKDKVLRQLRPRHQVVLMNFEGIPYLMSNKKKVKELGADVLIIDESSKLKDSTTQRFRRLRPLLHMFTRRHILTGSPVPRHYEDLFGQIFILDRGAALGSYVTHYRNQFFFPTGWEQREFELLPGAKEEINKLVAPLVMRLGAKDYLNLPKELERRHYVELPTAPMVHAAAARSRCAQIANGAVYLDPTPEDERWPSKLRPTRVVHTAKVEALVDLYEELQGEPILVCIGYHHDVTAIRKALGKDIPCINGGVTSKQRADFTANWNKGLLPMLMIHPASAGHGVNLQKFSAKHVAFFHIPDDLDQYEQAYKRVNRQGNKAEFVMRHLFIARATVDVPKMRNLERKGTTQQDFLKAMKEYDLERQKERSRHKRR